MQTIIRAIVEGAPAFALGLVWVAVARILVVQAYYLLILPFRRRYFEALRRASERVKELADPEDLAAVERIHEEEGLSVGGCLAHLGFVLGAILFALVSFVSVWHFVAAAAPPALAETAGWIGVSAGFGQVIVLGIVVWMRNEKELPLRMYVGVTLAFAVPAALLFALAPIGVVLYALTVFLLKLVVKGAWHVFHTGRVHGLIGLI